MDWPSPARLPQALRSVESLADPHQHRGLRPEPANARPAGVSAARDFRRGRADTRQYLVNGTSVLIQDVGSVEYHHVKLPRRDLLLPRPCRPRVIENGDRDNFEKSSGPCACTGLLGLDLAWPRSCQSESGRSRSRCCACETGAAGGGCGPVRREAPGTSIGRRISGHPHANPLPR